MADADIVNAIEETGGGGRPAGRGGRRRGSRDPKVFVLDRELSEVHLLLDNVSANPDTTLVERLAATQGLEDDLPDDWIEQVCRISWPPDGSDDDKAEDAALLIKAKDRLNRLSYPASGSTIAFTLLVTQEEAHRRRRRAQEAADDESSSPTRASLAQTAYPDLMPKALRFRKAMRGISIWLIVALALTCLLSWYVAYGNAALAELNTASAALADAQKRVSDAEAAEDKKPETLPPAAAPPIRSVVPGDKLKTPAVPAAAVGLPDKEGFVPLCGRGFYSTAAQAQACHDREVAEENFQRVERRLAGWVCWFCLEDLTDYDAPLASAGSGREASSTDADAKRLERKRAKAEAYNTSLIADAPSRAAAFANIMGTAVLPFLYGLLGAGAAIIRSLSRKIRASLLSPRDLHLSFQQLALGAVVGACIGLFIAAPGSDAGEGLLGPVTLSASAISFVAGFGVDSVFEALETLIKRIFNVAQPATGNRGDGVPNT
jgi:hypothetical protein